MKNKLQEKVLRLEDKKLNIITIIIDLIMLIILLLTLFLKKDFTYALYWTFINVFLIIDIINIMHWDYDGLKADVSTSNVIIRGFRDITTISIVLSGLVYLIIIFFEMINESISHNIYIIVIVFVLLAVSQLFNQLSINNAKRETQKLIDKTYNKK